MGKSVKGRRVLVTGSASGLGRDLALTLAGKGASLVLWDLDASGNEETARLVREAGAEAETRSVNVADPDAFAAAATATGDVWGVINNAGIVSGEHVLESTNARNELAFKVNCFAHFYAAKNFLPAMIRANDGIFITVSSVASMVGSPGLAAYAASKAAAKVFLETLAQEIALEAPGVHFACACPGPMDTPLFTGFGEGNSEVKILNSQDIARYIVNDLAEGGRFYGCWPLDMKAGAVAKGFLPERAWRALFWPKLRSLMDKHDMGQANKVFNKMGETQQHSKL